VVLRGEATCRLGSGAGFSGDRIDASVELARLGELDYLGLECLAERTIALAQLRRRRDPAAGFDPRLARRLEPLLPLCRERGFRIVTNLGAANPLGAADAIVAIAKRLRLPVKVAVVTGDDVLDRIDLSERSLEGRRRLDSYGEIVSANAYLGSDALLPALQSDADIVVTGRVADPSLFVAPLAHRFGIALDDWDALARATAVGHLLECAGQLCGGYFADPGVKDVPGLSRLGFPFADVSAGGDAVLGKVDGSGGVLTLATAKEQLLYEVTDPRGYVTPDVVADFSTIRMDAIAHDRVAVRGARGRARPDTLKVSVGYVAGFIGEGEIGYAGRNALARARLAGEVVRERLGGAFDELRVDLVGSTSLHGRSFDPDERPYEIRLRVAGRARDAARAQLVGEEVEALYTNGPAGGGGVRTSVFEQVGIVSTLVPRHAVRPQVSVREWRPDAPAP
jgi:hypothetical protein